MNTPNNRSVTAPGPSIVHLVSWRLNGPTPAERAVQAQQIVQAFAAIRDQVSGLLRLDVGSNVIEAPDAWDVAAVMLFESREALTAYLDHPAHLAIKSLVAPLRSARSQIDFELSA